jgi:hypothetical protein
MALATGWHYPLGFLQAIINDFHVAAVTHSEAR